MSREELIVKAAQALHDVRHASFRCTGEPTDQDIDQARALADADLIGGPAWTCPHDGRSGMCEHCVNEINTWAGPFQEIHRLKGYLAELTKQLQYQRDVSARFDSLNAMGETLAFKEALNILFELSNGEFGEQRDSGGAS